jgi:hypothetical protein
MLHTIGIIFVIIVLLVGLVGAALPYLPGLPLAFLGLVGLTYLVGEKYFNANWLWFFGLVTLASLACDYLAGFLGARWGKSSLYGTIGAVVGGIVGIVLLGLWGIILGPALGVLLFEFLAKRDHVHAVRVAQKTLITSVIALAANALLAIIFAIALTLLLIF